MRKVALWGLVALLGSITWQVALQACRGAGY
jgi:hypothetical protein